MFINDAIKKQNTKELKTSEIENERKIQKSSKNQKIVKKKNKDKSVMEKLTG